MIDESRLGDRCPATFWAVIGLVGWGCGSSVWVPGPAADGGSGANSGGSDAGGQGGLATSTGSGGVGGTLGGGGPGGGSPECSNGLTVCADACVDLQTDPAHCGSCDNACADMGVCDKGVCVYPPDDPWSKGFGGPGQDVGLALASDGTGSVVVTGRFEGSVDFGGGVVNGTSESDIFIAKYDKTGEHLWSKGFAGGNVGAGRSVASDAAGNVWLTGRFRGAVDFGGGVLTSVPSPIFQDMFLVRFDKHGKHLWSKSFGGEGADEGFGLTVDGAGNVLATGAYSNGADFGGGPLGVPSPGWFDIFVAKFDNNGKHLWSKGFVDSETSQHSIAEAVATDGLGNVLATGTLTSPVDFGGGTLSTQGPDVFMVKLDPSGKHLWSKRFGDGASQTGAAVATDGAGHVLVTGSFSGQVDFGGGPLTSNGQANIFVAKLDADGQHIWSKGYGSEERAEGLSIAVDGADNVLVTGRFGGVVDFGGGPMKGANGDIFVLALDKDGQYLWSKGYGSPNEDIGYAVTTDGANNVLVTGMFSGPINLGAGLIYGAGKRDIFLLKLKP